jgi:hypothetical protein
MKTLSLCACAVLIVLPWAVRAPAATPSVAVADLLGRVGRYAVRYEREFASVVAEETYAQAVAQNRTSARVARRVLRADMLFVELGGAFKWTTFRDVFEVDGSPVRDHQSRLETLFLESPALAVERAQKVVAESARYNIGDIARNFNLPILALVLVHPDNQHRFAFQAKGTKRIGRTQAVKLEFRETAAPTFITGVAGANLPCRGTLFVDPVTGRLLTSEVHVKDAGGHLDAEIKVTFGPWEADGIWVPAQMWESYDQVPDRLDAQERSLGQQPTDLKGTGQYVEGVAQYTKYRRFRISSTFTP